ncbi:hypothetical protein CXB77_01795 [Chromatium okenii]|uniref:PPM-type phosphatase domain-containing protein n=1 Tax=Chromatium okenii TaxID=61644 RepID=A0A2S7XVL7_9GAMM|nr:hypothetical protein CXB77_01795 [Chromatium okenii]
MYSISAIGRWGFAHDDNEGNIVRPFAKDARLIANETTSLCSEKAWNEMQICFQPLAGAPPTLILMATDGYANLTATRRVFNKWREILGIVARRRSSSRETLFARLVK